MKANLFSAGHVFAPKILSRSFSHWSAASGLVFALNFTGMVFQEVFQTPLSDWRSWLRTKHRGSRPVLLQLVEGLHVLLVGILRATLATSICCITSCCCSSDTACRCMNASCYCIIVVLCCVMATTIASITLTISNTSPWEDSRVLREGAIVHWHTGNHLVRLDKTGI